MKDFKTNELPRENFIIYYRIYLACLGLLLLWPAYWIFTKLRRPKKKFRKMETTESPYWKTVLERIWQFCLNPVKKIWGRILGLAWIKFAVAALPLFLSCVCICFDGNFCYVLCSHALSFYRSQNFLGWSKVFVPDQKFIYILWQSQTFFARKKDDLHSVKLVFVLAQKFFKRH